MSEKIVHTAVVDDCARLVFHDPQICRPFKTALTAHPEVARLGGATRLGDHHTPELLARYRELWTEAEPPEMLSGKLSFVLGWLSHRAADRNFKRVFHWLDLDCPYSPRDCSIYHDVEIMRRVYRSELPFASFMLEDGMASVEAVSDLFEGMWQRFLIKLHTFKPDENDPDTWLEYVLTFSQERGVDIRRYAEAYVNPDPEKYRKFVLDCNFYNPDDLLLRQLADLRRGEVLPAGVAFAVDETSACSLYARAVSRAYRYVRAASDFFERRLEMGELRTQLDIGKPEVLGADE